MLFEEWVSEEYKLNICNDIQCIDCPFYKHNNGYNVACIHLDKHQVYNICYGEYLKDINEKRR